MATTADGAREWVTRANQRPIGATAFREVDLQIGEGAQARTLAVRTARRLVGEVAQTLFGIAEPAGFRGLRYLVTEARGRLDPFEIDLFLPYAGGTLGRLPRHRRAECFLGSDFSYDDMRTWLYEEAHEYQLTEEEEERVCISGSCREAADAVRNKSERTEFVLARSDAFVEEMRHLDATGRCRLHYRAEDIDTVDGVRIARHMTMVDRGTGHRTDLLLKRAWFDRELPTVLFEQMSSADAFAALMEI